MTSRFSAPWRVVEIPSGFAVEDAAGQPLGVFYGRSDPNTAGHTGFLTIDEARQLAVDFAKLPELLKRALAHSEVAKATPRHESQSLAQVREGRRTSRKLEHLTGSLVRRSEIVEPVQRQGAHQLRASDTR
jgi:hypothetical protein